VATPTAALEKMGLRSDALVQMVKVDNRGLEDVLSGVLGLLTETMQRVQDGNDRESRLNERLASLERESGKGGAQEELLEKVTALESRLSGHDQKFKDQDFTLAGMAEKLREAAAAQERSDAQIAELFKKIAVVDNHINDLQEGQTSIASRIDSMEEEVRTQLDASKIQIDELAEVVERLQADMKSHNSQIANLQDDIIDKVDVRSLEPLRDTDRELQQRLDQINQALAGQLSDLESVVQMKSDVSAMELRAKQEDLDLIAEELRKRCTASEAATIQRLRELSNAIAALRMNGGGQGGEPTEAEQDGLAGFRVPVRCISCNRPKSPGTELRRVSPPRELSGTDGHVYGHMDTARDRQRRRPKSAVSRGVSSNIVERPSSAGLQRTSAETVQLEPLTEAQLLQRYGINPNPPPSSGHGVSQANSNPIRVPSSNDGLGSYSGSPLPGINVGRRGS